MCLVFFRKLADIFCTIVLALADRWGKTAQFFNSCGPTEVCGSTSGASEFRSARQLMDSAQITIVNTVHPHVPGKALSIGKPTPNNTIYILDEEMRPVPIGQQGIMWAGGGGITRGYLNLPDKTSERYRRDPFLNNGYAPFRLTQLVYLTYAGFRSTMFNTGDLGRWRPGGQLEHLGRIDDQVKVKGFRVELDGVAAAMEVIILRVETANHSD